MKIETIPIGDTYAYLVVCDATRRAAVVDPGEASPVRERAEALGVELTAVLCTHHHLDHSGGVAELVQQQPRLRVYAHVSERDRLASSTVTVTDAIDDGEPPGGFSEPPRYVDGVEIGVGQLTVRVMHVPGHTSGSLAFHVGDALLCGDTLLAGGTNRNFERNADVLLGSLERLAALPDETRVFGGRAHELANLELAARVDPTNARLGQRLERVRALSERGEPAVGATLAEERATNPFLRCGDAALAAHVLGAREDDDVPPLQLFSQLMTLREHALGSAPAASVAAAQPEPDPTWAAAPAHARYEQHLSWRRDFASWIALPAAERLCAIHDPTFWSSLTSAQQQNVLREADWQELRHVPAAREQAVASLLGLDEVASQLGLDVVQVYWLMSTRKLGGWLIDGNWRFDRWQVDRFVKDFGGIAPLRRDVVDQISAHSNAQAGAGGRTNTTK